MSGRSGWMSFCIIGVLALPLLAGCQDDSLSVPRTTYGLPDRSNVPGRYLPHELHLFVDGQADEQLEQGGDIDLELFRDGSAQGNIVFTAEGEERQIDLDGTWSFDEARRDLILDAGADTTISFSAGMYAPERVTLIADRQSVGGWVLQFVVQQP